ncbi:solute carrier organic anion transporter family member 4A1 [Aplysia californica]|uniref:Solute carrier organic anion transporter family member 4A1 n=1 Tax=Aplysia californica TaxID=6500 RepID=A0ABM0K3H3_APLCA|nr:solute carrier organic anion transporter family member 4A1 [Aplysia californica]
MIIIDIIIVSIPFTGIGFFRTVYAANEYNVPMAEAAMLSGYVQAVGNIAGTLLSAWISTRVRTKAGYIWIIFATYAVVTCVVPAYLYLDCPNYPVYGHEGELGLPANMTDMCGCETEKQLLSCGSDGLHYYSPCHAGCTSLDGKTFMECTGLATGNGTVTPGLCDTTCHDNFVIYTVLNGVQGLVFTMAMVPRRLLLFRVVSAQDRGFAGSMLFFFFDFRK